MIKKYNDMDILFLHIDNHSKFLKHKEKLKNIKGCIIDSIKSKELETAREVFKKSKRLSQDFRFKDFVHREGSDNLVVKSKLESIHNRHNVSDSCNVYLLLYCFSVLFNLSFLYFNCVRLLFNYFLVKFINCNNCV